MKDNQTVIETNRLILRPIKLVDAQQMFDNWACDPEVTRYLEWDAHKDVNETINIISTWLNEYKINPSFFQWVIAVKEDNNIIGTITCFDDQEIGYCIAKKYWNQGITSEALEAVIKFMFEEIQIDSLWARHNVKNINSGKVMLKCGMKFDHKAFKKENPEIELSFYSISRLDYLDKHKL